MAFENMEAVIFVGIPASGKSTFYRQYFAGTHVRVNLDTLKTRRREQALVESCIAAGQPFVVDNTNATREQRAGYILPAKAAGFRVIGYYFESKLGDCIARNRAREPSQVVPDKGIAAVYYRLQIPVMDEGFGALYIVRINGEGGFSVEQCAGQP